MSGERITAAEVMDAAAPRFFAKVQYPPNGTGCMVWTAWRNDYGYGTFIFGKTRSGRERKYAAHRWAYEYCVGPIPPGFTIDHLCRNRACVNPDHLEPVTNRVNVMRGDTLPAINARRTHCPKGHAYAGDNLRIARRGHRTYRVCRACRRQHDRRYRGVFQ